MVQLLSRTSRVPREDSKKENGFSLIKGVSFVNSKKLYKTLQQIGFAVVGEKYVRCQRTDIGNVHDKEDELYDKGRRNQSIEESHEQSREEGSSSLRNERPEGVLNVV